MFIWGMHDNKNARQLLPCMSAVDAGPCKGHGCGCINSAVQDWFLDDVLALHERCPWLLGATTNSHM